MKAFVHTFGCQMNVHDSNRMEECLVRAGFDLTDAPKKADLIIINSCAIREKAEQKMLSALGRYTRYKHNRPALRIVLAGCVAQLRGKDIGRRFKELDLILGTDQISSFVEWLHHSTAPERALLYKTQRADPTQFRFLPANPTAGSVGVTAYVTIMKGCNNQCAYCVVPTARGPQINRSESEILSDVDRLVDAGAREIVLIGQNVNAYKGKKLDFAELLVRVADHEGVARVRFTTSHPRDLDRATVEAVASHPAICEHFHLPVQSGSTRILHRMGRGYDREKYLEKISWIKQKTPEAAISTDMIVGFPGESEADFADTLSLVERVGYTFIYSFCYSSRPHTRAAAMKDELGDDRKLKRLRHLQKLQDTITQKHLQSWVGKTTAVLVEGASQRGGGQLRGRTPTFEIVNFYASHEHERPHSTAKSLSSLVGRILTVEITGSGKHTLEGRPVDMLPQKSKPFHPELDSAQRPNTAQWGI